MLELYAMVTPLVPMAVLKEDKRPQVEMDLAFVERGEVDDGLPATDTRGTERS